MAFNEKALNAKREAMTQQERLGREAMGIGRRRFLTSVGAAAVGLACPGWTSQVNTGGRPAKGDYEATGFFRVEEVGGKWVVFDPDGRPVYLRGLNHYGDGTHMPHNLEGRHGTAEAWRTSVRERHRAWGFNYLPPSVGPSESTPFALPPVPTETGGRRWKEPVAIHRTPEWEAEHYAALEFPFAPFMDVPKQYMSGTDLPDVFSDAFREQIDQRARELAGPLAESPHLVGYHFVHNPPWDATNPAFDFWIANIVAGEAGRREWTSLMHQIYGTVERWREVYGMPISSFEEIMGLRSPLRGYVSEQRARRDRIAFMERVCERWYQVFTEAIRRYDRDHLILGDRNTIHLSPLPDYAVRIMARYVDVVSVNVMGPAETFYGVLEQVTRHYDGPILLADTGAGIYDGVWAKSVYQARDLEEFDALYASYMEAGLEHPQLVGFGWCGYYETPSSRSGLVDARTDEPLGERIAVMEKWNAWMEGRFPKRVAELVAG